MDTKPKGLDTDLTRRIIKVMATSNVWLYRRTGGRVGGTWRIGAGFRNPVPICLLEHHGRRTGKLRSVRRRAPTCINLPQHNCGTRS